MFQILVIVVFLKRDETLPMSISRKPYFKSKRGTFPYNNVMDMFLILYSKYCIDVYISKYIFLYIVYGISEFPLHLFSFARFSLPFPSDIHISLSVCLSFSLFPLTPLTPLHMVLSLRIMNLNRFCTAFIFIHKIHTCFFV